jgi:hypothetical protein
MRRLISGVLMVASLSVLAALPVAAGKASGPAAGMAKPGGCETIAYSWSNFRKATTARIAVHHDGIYMAEGSQAPIGADGSFALPSELAQLLVAGEHYTFLGHLKDAAGRSITPSGAAWWGLC